MSLNKPQNLKYSSTYLCVIGLLLRRAYSFGPFTLIFNMEEFIAHQIELVETERKIDVEETLKLLSAYAPIQLQKRGVALVGLKVTGSVMLYKC